MNSPPPPTTNPEWKYDVFLSFRGEDTRKNIVDYLYPALDQNGIYTFKDDEKLARGKSIAPELFKTIKESRSAIIVFSKNYATSSWCLDELTKIMESRKLIGQKVFPVFYDVDPSDITKEDGTFATALAQHEKTSGDTEKVQCWRDALMEAANISWELKNTANGLGRECIKLIVSTVLSHLGRTNTSSPDYLIGIESHVQKVKSLMGMENEDVCVIGIWGMGGIGKSTIAGAVFNQISNGFQDSSYLANIRDVSTNHGLQYLQEKLLSEILLERHVKVRDPEEGAFVIKSRLCHKRVLIVLDDVDKDNQLERLAGGIHWFGRGSRIIVTTRNKHLLLRHGVDKIYEVDLLNDNAAIQLFCRYAFKKNQPTEVYKEFLLPVLCYAGGLPLALKVLGFFLYGRDVNEWKSAMQRLKETPENEIMQNLKVSFEGLKDMEKEIFLDIACFFNGKKKDNLLRILDSFGPHSALGINVLIEKALVTFSEERLQLHVLVQEMGRHMVRQLYPKEPWRHSRLWIPQDVHEVLLMENMGFEEIKAIVLDLAKQSNIIFSTKALTNMKKLRLLKVHGASVSRGPEYLPNELRWFDWHGYPSAYLPANFWGNKLVGLKMCESNIVQLWKGEKILANLKYINLSHSKQLRRILDLSGFPNLERLILDGCSSLEEVHPSIVVLKRLVFLSLHCCTNLRTLASSIHLESLNILNLSFCKKLETVPKILGNMKHLVELHLGHTAVKELPPSIEHLTNLALIDLNSCEYLSGLPDTICSLKCLKILNLQKCSKLEDLPENLGHIESLEELLLDETAIRKPPPSIVLLNKLKVLSLGECKGTPPSSWVSLFLARLLWRGSQKCSGLLLPSLSGLNSLKKLDLGGCHLLEHSIPNDLCCLSSLEELNLSRNDFVFLPKTICLLPQLKILNLRGCQRLESLQELPSSIAELYADDCHSLQIIEHLSEYQSLWKLSLVNCFKLLEDWQSNHVTDVLIESLLQDNSAKNHEFNIMLPGVEIPEWFSHQSTGYSLSLSLPLHWNTKITGFAVCILLDIMNERPHVEATFKLISHNSYNSQAILPTTISCTQIPERTYAPDHFWFGYIPFGLFHRTQQDYRYDVECSLLIDFGTSSDLPKMCGACLVLGEDGNLGEFRKTSLYGSIKAVDERSRKRIRCDSQCRKEEEVVGSGSSKREIEEDLQPAFVMKNTGYKLEKRFRFDY